MKTTGLKAWTGTIVFMSSVALFAQAGLQAFFGLPDNKGKNRRKNKGNDKERRIEEKKKTIR